MFALIREMMKISHYRLGDTLLSFYDILAAISLEGHHEHRNDVPPLDSLLSQLPTFKTSKEKIHIDGCEDDDTLSGTAADPIK